NVQGVDGGTIAKFEFHNVSAVRHAVRLDGNDLVIDFPNLSDSDNLPEPPLVAEGSAAAPEAATAPADAGSGATTLQPLAQPLAAEKPSANPAPSPAPGSSTPEVKRGPVPS